MVKANAHSITRPVPRAGPGRGQSSGLGMGVAHYQACFHLLKNLPCGCLNHGNWESHARFGSPGQVSHGGHIFSFLELTLLFVYVCVCIILYVAHIFYICIWMASSCR